MAAGRDAAGDREPDRARVSCGYISRRLYVLLPQRSGHANSPCAAAQFPWPAVHQEPARSRARGIAVVIRLLVADDHAIVRLGLRQICTMAPDFRLAGEARNGWEVIREVAAGGFDLLLLDLVMPGPSGVELLKRVRKEAPRLPVLVFSVHGEAHIVARAIKVGARGYLTKDCEPETLIAAIRQVAAGGYYMDPGLATSLIYSEAQAQSETPHTLLTDREYEIFQLLVEGSSANEIAARLHLSPKTVSTHKFRFMRKLGVKNTVELVQYALKHGLLR